MNPEPEADEGSLVRTFEALANATRVELLHRLGRPAFLPDLAKEFGMTRQALRKHLAALEAAGLVRSRPARRGALPAAEYAADPGALFAFKEGVQAIAIHTDPASLLPAATVRAGDTQGGGPRGGAGLLLVHGDAPGRWFPLVGKSSWILGREPKADVALTYDAFASARHALLALERGAFRVTDLHSTNGTRVNFRPLAAGETQDLRPGDLLTVGRSHLLLRGGT